jgi:hypothetical protein
MGYQVSSVIVDDHREQARSYSATAVYLTHRVVCFASKPAPTHRGVWFASMPASVGGAFVRTVQNRLYPSFTLR